MEKHGNQRRQAFAIQGVAEFFVETPLQYAGLKPAKNNAIVCTRDKLSEKIQTNCACFLDPSVQRFGRIAIGDDPLIGQFDHAKRKRVQHSTGHPRQCAQ